MHTDDFARLESLFDAIAPLDTEARARALDASCADRHDLRAEVVALLAAHDRIANQGNADDAARHDHVAVGTQLGVFRLIEQVGEGGMGEVYRAERTDGAFTQQVAIKIMRSALVNSDLLRRFKVERQILASLQHPNIVTLLDGGATAEGRAYIVMEFVDGIEIMRHCRERQLSLNERLWLFRTLCSAVQYAHQHGIVHRDLKPANILIGSDGTLKVLDFGVAKLLQQPSDGTDATRGVLPGPLTPNYASPEQLLGLPVTTASDGYALGILLYELVTGVRPYETQGLTLDRLLDIVVHTDPVRPSVMVPGHRHLRGDLDAIVLKAISKDAANRYNSAGELGNDVARFVAGEPVLARSPSTGYILRRLATRNKTLVTVSGLALVGILTASGVALWQRQIAVRQQARAEQRFREVRQLANALIFKIHDAVAPLAGSTPVRRTIVDEALAYLERLEHESGAGDATLRLELAAAYRQIAAILGDPQKSNLGDREGAIAQYERARALAAAVAATNPAFFQAVSGVVDADLALTTLYSLKHSQERAIAAARDAVEFATRFATDHPGDDRATSQAARANFSLAWALPPAQAVPVWEQTLASYEDALTKDPASAVAQRNVALIAKYLGGAFETLAQRDRAAPHYARAVELDEARLRATPADRAVLLDTAISVSGLAALAEARGDLDEAARLFDRSLAIRRSVVDADPKDVRARERLGYAMFRNGKIQRRRGELAFGRAQIAEAVQLLTRLHEVTKDWTTEKILAETSAELGRVEIAMNDLAAACAAFREADRHYRNTSANHSVHDKAESASAAREVARCDGVSAKKRPS